MSGRAGVRPRPTVGVTTLVSGRRAHLANLLDGLAAQSLPPDRVVVVRMDGEPVEHDLPLQVVDVPATHGRLPLAAARNAGVRALCTDQVVLLDVDCIPGPGFVAGYAAALDRQARDGLVCGTVSYLPPGDVTGQPFAALSATAAPHRARPVPAAGELMRDDRHALAWTTSLAFRRETFELIGGFDERYVGYGGEDTDFTERARIAGVGVWWTGDAPALHQHHGPGGLPVQHLADIVRNARLFQDAHGWWPMRGWLEEFRDLGLVDFDLDANRLTVTA